VPRLPDHLLRGGERWRATYASDPQASRGRLHPEPQDPLRSPFQRDRDRVIHSNAFRRLKHKTQVFVHHEGDHFRTRLTHSLEVAQIARSIARPLGLDEDLAEALALAHDLGHPPFGHAGERALDHALGPFGGFDHNAQSVRVVTALERRYPAFDGLNLTWETLEGLVKHNGPLAADAWRILSLHAGAPLPPDLDANLFAGLEAQVASISDDIAYDCHDLEDGLRAGLVCVGGLDDVAATAPILSELRAAYPALDAGRKIHELVRRLITVMIHDVLGETARRLGDLGAANADDVRRAGRALVGFSDEFAGPEAALKRFLQDQVYRSDNLMRTVRVAERLVAELFEAFTADPGLMPEDWGSGVGRSGDRATARRVADYIAGMTDRYAVSEHARLFDATPDLV
jgi:dGTPase